MSILVKIDGKPTRGLSISELNKLLRGAEGTTVQLQVFSLRNNELVETSLIREEKQRGLKDGVEAKHADILDNLPLENCFEPPLHPWYDVTPFTTALFCRDVLKARRNADDRQIIPIDVITKAIMHFDRVGRCDLAESLLDEVLNHITVGTSFSNPDVMMIMRFAEHLENSGRFKAAGAVFEALLQNGKLSRIVENDVRPRCLSAFAQLLAKQGKHDEAKVFFDELSARVKQQPRRPLAESFAAAQFYSETNNHQQAIQLLQGIIEAAEKTRSSPAKFPSVLPHIYAHYKLALAYFHAGRFDDAKLVLDAAIISYAEATLQESMLVAIEQTANIEPTPTDLRRLLAETLIALGRLIEAKEELDLVVSTLERALGNQQQLLKAPLSVLLDCNRTLGDKEQVAVIASRLSSLEAPSSTVASPNKNCMVRLELIAKIKSEAAETELETRAFSVVEELQSGLNFHAEHNRLLLLYIINVIRLLIDTGRRNAARALLLKLLDLMKDPRFKAFRALLLLEAALFDKKLDLPEADWWALSLECIQSVFASDQSAETDSAAAYENLRRMSLAYIHSKEYARATMLLTNVIQCSEISEETRSLAQGDLACTLVLRGLGLEGRTELMKINQISPQKVLEFASIHRGQKDQRDVIFVLHNPMLRTELIKIRPRAHVQPEVLIKLMLADIFADTGSEQRATTDLATIEQSCLQSPLARVAGGIAFRCGQFEKACTFFSRVRNTFRTPGVSHMPGHVADRRQFFLDYLVAANEVAGFDPVDKAKLLYELSTVQRQMDSEEADSCLRLAVNLLPEGNPERTSMQQILANSFSIDKNEKLQLQLKAAIDSEQNPSDTTIQAWLAVAETEVQLSKPKEAIEHIRHILQLREQQVDPNQNSAKAILHYSDSGLLGKLSQMGYENECQQILEQLVEIEKRRFGCESREALTAMAVLTECLALHGKFDAATALLNGMLAPFAESTAALSERRTSRLPELRKFYSIAQYFGDNRENVLGVRFLEGILAIQRQHLDMECEEIGHTLLSLARLCSDVRDLDRSLCFVQEALIFEKKHLLGPPGRSQCYQLYRNLLLRQDRRSEATVIEQEESERSARIKQVESVGKHPYGVGCGNAPPISPEVRDKTRLASFNRAAAALQEFAPLSDTRVKFLSEFAALYEQAGNLVEAKQLLNQSLKIQLLKVRCDPFRTLLDLARLSIITGMPEEARALLKRAKSLDATLSDMTSPFAEQFLSLKLDLGDIDESLEDLAKLDIFARNKIDTPGGDSRRVSNEHLLQMEQKATADRMANLWIRAGHTERAKALQDFVAELHQKRKQEQERARFRARIPTQIESVQGGLTVAKAYLQLSSWTDCEDAISRSLRLLSALSEQEKSSGINNLVDFGVQLVQAGQSSGATKLALDLIQITQSASKKMHVALRLTELAELLAKANEREQAKTVAQSIKTLIAAANTWREERSGLIRRCDQLIDRQ
ncbi:MAG TPA: hypothetical protein V6C81_11200 [Planktothrix sp.]